MAWIKTGNVSRILLAGLLGACSSDAEPPDLPATAAFAATSPAFDAGGSIPKEYTCDGRAFPVALTNPELDWTDGPAGTKSYAIVVKHLAIVDDLPSTDPNYFKGFMWTIWDIPAGVHTLPKDLSREQFPPQIAGAQQWSIRNQFGYFAPCPNADPAPIAADPSTQVTNDYGFDVYALSTEHVTLPAKEADVSNYTWTLTKTLDVVNIGVTRLLAKSDAVAGTAPVPVDATMLQYPVPAP
jgi:phosphatidylethanolamine-binding protein (PEBP) family uncharacterized protein